MDTDEYHAHAEALWHTLWFHAFEALHATGPSLITQDEVDAGLHSAEEMEDYNAYEQGRDFPAEVERHRATVAACRSAYALWGIPLPDDDTIVNNPRWPGIAALACTDGSPDASGA